MLVKSRNQDHVASKELEHLFFAVILALRVSNAKWARERVTPCFCSPLLRVFVKTALLVCGRSVMARFVQSEGNLRSIHESNVEMRQVSFEIAVPSKCPVIAELPT